MRIAIAADRGGYQLKQYLLERLSSEQIEITDFGCEDPDSPDYIKGYPDYAEVVAQQVVQGMYDRGILICGTGIGMSIAANKVKGIRCALVHDLFSAEQTRMYNDSNVLALGEMIVGQGLAYEIVKIWLNTKFTGNVGRLHRIKEIEYSQE